MTLDLPDLAAMDALGRRIAALLRPGDVIALSGELGAGKTTMARAIIAAAGHGGEIPSPTFAIIEHYGALEPAIVHADFYRLDDPAELAELGLSDYRDGAVLIAEWPERAGGFVHDPACLTVRLERRGEGRRAIVEPGADWLTRWP